MKCTVQNGDYGFEYHNDGYIHLAGCNPYRRNIFCKYTQGSNAIVGLSEFRKEDERQFICLHGNWYKILHVTDSKNATVDRNLDATGTDITLIGKMKELYVDGDRSG